MCDGDLIEPENLPQRIARLTPGAGGGTAGAAGDSQNSAQTGLKGHDTPHGASSSHNTASPDSALSLKEKVRRYEMALIREALDSCGGSMAEAARRLQVERSLLYKKIEKFGMR